mmetsp:Transcript_10317/g.21696  ORF Transcript_10317/g.21696 Transcript_10317/m.21696 type:complete len:416 (-) Transcript_10317:99-1346(-)
MSVLTLPARACVIAPTALGSTSPSSDVPCASCCGMSAASPSVGTMTVPPPTPSRPERNPATAPIPTMLPHRVASQLTSSLVTEAALQFTLRLVATAAAVSVRSPVDDDIALVAASMETEFSLGSELARLAEEDDAAMWSVWCARSGRSGIAVAASMRNAPNFLRSSSGCSFATSDAPKYAVSMATTDNTPAAAGSTIPPLTYTADAMALVPNTATRLVPCASFRESPRLTNNGTIIIPPPSPSSEPRPPAAAPSANDFTLSCAPPRLAADASSVCRCCSRSASGQNSSSPAFCCSERGSDDVVDDDVLKAVPASEGRIAMTLVALAPAGKIERTSCSDNSVDAIFVRGFCSVFLLCSSSTQTCFAMHVLLTPELSCCSFRICLSRRTTTTTSAPPQRVTPATFPLDLRLLKSSFS